KHIAAPLKSSSVNFGGRRNAPPPLRFPGRARQAPPVAELRTRLRGAALPRTAYAASPQSCSAGAADPRTANHTRRIRVPSRDARLNQLSKISNTAEAEGTLMSTRTPPPSMQTVNVGRETAGFVLNRGAAGFEGFDAQERSLGLFKSAADAANAILAEREGA